MDESGPHNRQLPRGGQYRPNRPTHQPCGALVHCRRGLRLSRRTSRLLRGYARVAELALPGE